MNGVAVLGFLVTFTLACGESESPGEGDAAPPAADAGTGSVPIPYKDAQNRNCTVSGGFPTCDVAASPSIACIAPEAPGFVLTNVADLIIAPPDAGKDVLNCPACCSPPASDNTLNARYRSEDCAHVVCAVAADCPGRGLSCVGGNCVR